MSSYEDRAAQARREMADEQWETVPAPNDPPRRLDAQVVIRLDRETAERSRQLGEAYHTPYTALLRGWLAERIRHEWDALQRKHHADAGRVIIRPRPEGGWEVRRSGTDNDGRIGVYQDLERAERVGKVVADAEARAYDVKTSR